VVRNRVRVRVRTLGIGLGIGLGSGLWLGMGLGIELGSGFEYFRQYNVIRRIGIRRNGIRRIGIRRNGAEPPTLPIIPNFYRAFVGVDPANIPAKFEVRSFTRS